MFNSMLYGMLYRNELEYNCRELALEKEPQRFKEYILKLVQHLKSEGVRVEIVSTLDEEINVVIPIASGGFGAATLISDYLGADELFSVRYSHITRKDSKVVVPKCAPSKHALTRIEGKNILIVDDIVNTGITASELVHWTNKKCAKKVYFATIELWDSDWKPGSLRKCNGSKHFYVAR